MKKSKTVPATLLTSIAAVVLVGCGGRTEVRRCVDDKGNILPDVQCQSPGRVGGYYGYPHWVYGGSVNGNRVSNFRSTPTDGATIKSSSGQVISRGGFGGSSSRSGGGFFGG